MTKFQVVLILLVALAARLGYHQLVPAFDGSYHNGSDSGKYIVRAISIVEHGAVVHSNYEGGQVAVGVVDGEARPDFGRMPLYPQFVAAIFRIAGKDNLAAVTAVQALISSFTPVAIGLIGGAFSRRWMMPAALLGCFWPAFVVYASLVLTDSIFVDCFTWGLCFCTWALRGRRCLSLLLAAGVAFGLAFLTRPILMFFPFLLVPVLSCLLVTGHRMGWFRAVSLALVPALIMFVAVSPRLISSYANYGSAVVSTQSGYHALELIYPCLRNDRSCERTSHKRRAFEMIASRKALLTEQERQNPVIIHSIIRDVAAELFMEVPLRILALQFADGSLRSVVQTMLYEVGDQLNLNPRYFSSVQGATLSARTAKFVEIVFTDPFMFLWAVTQSFILLVLPIQFFGMFLGVRSASQRPMAIFLVLTAGYFLVLNLSFGNPKYGLPLNPAEIIFLVAGAFPLFDYFRRRSEGEWKGKQNLHKEVPRGTPSQKHSQ